MACSSCSRKPLRSAASFCSELLLQSSVRITASSTGGHLIEVQLSAGWQRLDTSLAQARCSSPSTAVSTARSVLERWVLVNGTPDGVSRLIEEKLQGKTYASLISLHHMLSR